MGSVAENLAAVEARIKAACTRVGRDPSEVRLLPVSKNQGMDLVSEAYEAGVRLLGENKVQEAMEKARHFADHPDLRWAIIGHLQTNKTRHVASIASEFHALDTVKVARRLIRLWRIRAAVSMSSCKSTHPVNRKSTACHPTRWRRSLLHSGPTGHCAFAV